MVPQAPWSPTAQAFAHHQFSHVVNFWKQGRPASLRLEALPGGRAELSLTFQLPPASELQSLKWSLPHPMYLQFLLLNAQYTPSFPKAAFPKGLVQAPTNLSHNLPLLKFPQDSAKATAAQCCTRLV